MTTGYQDLLVGYVSNAYTSIQNLRPKWKFLHTNVSFNLTQGKTSYSIFDIFATSIDLVAGWETTRFIWDNSGSKVALQYVPYEQYVLEDWTAEGKPYKFTVNIENNALTFSNLDAAYTIVAHYHSKAQTLVNNTDTPLMPSQHTQAIYFQAVSDISLKLGFYSVHELFKVKANAAIGSLMRSQNPPKKVRSRGIA